VLYYSNTTHLHTLACAPNDHPNAYKGILHSTSLASYVHGFHEGPILWPVFAKKKLIGA
jgi:hypothetical protein